jgi:hypothetical protein
MQILQKINRLFKIIVNGKCRKCNEPFEEIPYTGIVKCKCGRKIPII